MGLHPNVLQYERTFRTIESHTMGEPTRIVVDGFPALKGDSMMERKEYLETHFDQYRKALMLEPRGHRDMFGALLTEPIHKEADLGVIFMDSGGYLNMCGHGSIGAATIAVETGLVEVKEPYTEVVLEAPAGMIRATVRVENKRAKEVSFFNVPAFLYKRDLTIETEKYGTITYDISFGGSFFILVDAESIHLEIEKKNIAEITELGMYLLKKVNEEVCIQHPYLDITTADLVEFYCRTDNPKADKKNVVIFGEGQADRSPCGTGTSAKLAALYAKKEIALGEEFVYESITGTLFKGIAAREIQLNDEITAIIPQITGSAYVTGTSTWILDAEDPIEYGFLFGAEPKLPKPDTEKATVDLADLFDRKYAELMMEMNPKRTPFEKLLYLNRELFSMIEKEVPVQTVASSYSMQMLSRQKEKESLLNPNRLYYQLIRQIIEAGMEQGEFSKTYTVDEIADRYAMFERGMLYDWCIMDGRSKLSEYSQSELPVILNEYRQEKV